MQVKKSQKILTTIGIMLVMFLVSLDMLVVTNALPKITTALGGSNYYTWVITSYTLVLTITTPIAGKISDIFGRKWIYIGGITIFIIGSMLCGLSENMLALIIFRSIQAVGGGAVMGLSLAVISDIFSAQEVGKYMGVVMSMSALASLIGPALGGFITDKLSWHWVFFINVPAAAGAIFVLFIGMPKMVEKVEKVKLDIFGALLIAGFTVSLMLALTWGGQKGNGGYDWLSPQIMGLLSGSMVALILLLVVEARAEQPIIPLNFFRKSIYTVANLMNFLISIVLMSVMVFIPEYLQILKGYSATRSGALQTPLLVSMTLASILGGQIVSRSGKYKLLMLFGGLVTIAGSALLVTLTVHSSDGAIMTYQAVLGFGAGLVYPVLTIAIRNIFGSRELGAATASFQFFKNFSTSIGVAVLGALIIDAVTKFKISGLEIKALAEKAKIAAASNPQAALAMKATLTKAEAAFTRAQTNLMSAFHSVFWVCTAVAVLVFFISFLLKEVPLKTEEVVEPK